ncbi:MAG: DNA replication/repair protein RecF [Gammaproteobacteria bacterium]|nr:MAG: DNA replication/repair protein RecF [Gammaproteobacteria bacterium]
MPLTYLQAANIRILEHVELTPASGLNVIAGANGSGKTSVLEAIHLLALGRTFRSGQGNQLLRAGTTTLMARGNWRTYSGEEVALGIERGAAGRRVHINGVQSATIGALARVMPIQALAPDSRYLFTHSARYRRGVIDWGLFHVEPHFYALWSRYQRALQQRNAALRAGANDTTLDSWDDELARSSEQVQALRADYQRQWARDISYYARALLATGELRVSLQQGWPAELSLREAFWASRGRDRARGYTSCGAHRSDLVATLEGAPLRERGSHGQQTLAVMALRLAQVALYLRGARRQCVLLLDDIVGELDGERRHKLMTSLRELGTQVFITTTDVSSIAADVEQTAVFHVEQGQLSAPAHA